MRFKWLSGYWTGLILTVSIAVASLWLAATDKLTLYIHPRYTLFTVIMCGLAILGVLAGVGFSKKLPHLARPERPMYVAASSICLLLCVGLLVFRPGSLTSLTAQQRGINTGAATSTSESSLHMLRSSEAAYENFSVKEWASLLGQSTDPALFQDKPARLTGFISPTPNNDPNVFYVSRFVITCCAVDAQPVGVPVYKPGWQAAHQRDRWIEIRGTFMRNPQADSIPIVLDPKTITPIEEPDNPYAY